MGNQWALGAHASITVALLLHVGACYGFRIPEEIQYS